MYLHIGNGEIVGSDDIIGIFDMDTATVSASSKQFLSKAEQKKEICYRDDDIPKSFIVCDDSISAQKIFFSKISTNALKLRTDSFLSEYTFENPQHITV